MKRTVFLLMTLWCITLHAQELTVASYNVRNDNKGDVQKGNGWERRCPVICQLVRFHHFDIFGAQEVLDHQLKDMLKLLPGYDYIGVGRDDGATKGEYAPIFYNKEKLKLLHSGNFWLSTITDRPNKGWDAALPRICTWGEFKTGKTKFWFFNLHMDHIGVEARKESAKLVLSKIREMCGKDPIILTGDFNVDQHNESYILLSNSDILDDSYEKSPIKYALNGTFNGFNAHMKTDSRIDHIFVSPFIKVARYGVLTDSYRTEIDKSHVEVKSGNFPKEVSLHEYVARVPSDHFPVMVELQFK